MADQQRASVEIPKRRKQLRYEQFERMGEVRVSQLITSGRYTGQTLAWAREWLSNREAPREAERKESLDERMWASNLESLRIARSAKNAAWAAAIAGIIAIIVAAAMPFILSRLGIEP